MKEIIEIEKSKLRNAYNSATKDIKSFLNDLFDKDVFTPQKITGRVRTFEDACIVLGVCAEQIIPYRSPCTRDQVSINAYSKLIVIAKALNEGWTPDWADSSQYKYYCWFKANASGVGLSYNGYGCAYTNTNVGSRLVFRSSELATFAGKQFESIYNEYLSL